MKKFIILINLLILITYNSYCQPNARGFKNIEKGEYDKAIEFFTKHLKENPDNSILNLGAAIIYSSDNYIGHDYFRAWDYIVIANSNFNNLTPDENNFLKEYFGETDPHRRNRTNRYNYDIEVKNIEDKLIKFVREENNIDIAEKFIKLYPNSKYYENVVHIRNHLKFRIAEKTNTLESYLEFIKNYPEAAQVPKARKACCALAFEKSKNINTIDGYNGYMKEYPEAEQYVDALKLRDQLAFNNAKNINTIDAISGFISSYPRAMEVMNARTILKRLIYEKAKQVNTLEAYNEFISKYPEGEYFVDIFNLKSNTLGKNMADKFEGNKEAIAWIKGFDFEDYNEYAGGLIETSDGNVIVAGNRQKSGADGTQCWIISVDKTGKVMWNKTYGSQAFNHANQIISLQNSGFLISGWAGRSPDTLNRKSWILKVSVTGNGIWEKNLDGSEIKDLIRTSDNEYYFGGYQLDDSLRMKIYLEKLNSDFKKLWSRQYLHKGSLNGISMNDKNEVNCASGKWLFRVNSQGYFVWEKLLQNSDSITIYKNNNNQGLLCGTRNGNPLILKINDVGVVQSEIIPSSSDSSLTVACQQIPGKGLIVVTCNQKDTKIKLTDEQGRELKSLFLRNCIFPGPNSLYVNNSGEIFITVSALNDMNRYNIGVFKLIF